MPKRLALTLLLAIVIATPLGVYVYMQYDMGFKARLMGLPTAEIYIQAGHEGRTRGATGASGPFGNEIDWTPIVANEATRILEEAGITVIRAQADDRQFCVVDLALSIHFDGCAQACGSGASIGYDDPTDKPAADAWKAFYSQAYPHRWMRDNFTRNLSQYYNYRYTITRDAELVLEMGDITCPSQARWMKDNLLYLGQLVAEFAAQRIGKAHLLTK